MILLWRWLLYGMAFYAVVIGLWDHSWRLILAGIAVWIIYPLISSEVEDVAATPLCAGCSKGRIVPGCPVHDEERRKAAA